MLDYKYSALGEDEIRLVKLLPGDFDDQLRLNIIHKRLLPDQAAPTTGAHLTEELQEALEHLAGKWHALQTPEVRNFCCIC